MHFVANLRQETIDVFSAEAIQPAAYLLSSHRVSPAALRMAAAIRSEDLPLFADNGTKPMIDAVVKLFEDQARAVRLAVRALRADLGRSPRKADIPPDLRAAAATLAEAVVDHAVAVSDAIDAAAVLDKQLSMNPTHLIAQEDFASACLLALGLEPEITGWRTSRWDTRNRRSIRLWKRVAQDPRCHDIVVHAVLSAVDYNSARSAGRIAAAKGVRHAALGIAGINLDSSAVDHFMIGARRIDTQRPAPRRFIRLAQILKGLADGYAREGVTLESFHCLGLGAPAMLPIAAAALPEATAITADATSPIHDAVRDHVLYDAARQGDRATRVEIVDRIVRRKSWPLASPFARAFGRKFGHQPGNARRAWKDAARPDITAALLKMPGGITAALPLFSAADRATTVLASKAHIAHNHWVLGELCDQFASGPGRHDRAKAALETWLALRTSSSTTRGLAAARQVLELAGD